MMGFYGDSSDDEVLEPQEEEEVGTRTRRRRLPFALTGPHSLIGFYDDSSDEDVLGSQEAEGASPTRADILSGVYVETSDDEVETVSTSVDDLASDIGAQVEGAETRCGTPCNSMGASSNSESEDEWIFINTSK